VKYDRGPSESYFKEEDAKEAHNNLTPAVSQSGKSKAILRIFHLEEISKLNSTPLGTHLGRFEQLAAAMEKGNNNNGKQKRTIEKKLEQIKNLEKLRDDGRRLNKNEQAKVAQKDELVEMLNNLKID